MIERYVRRMTEKRNRQGTTVKLARSLRDPQEFARRTGGDLISKGVFHAIAYGDRTILWKEVNGQTRSRRIILYLDNEASKEFKRFVDSCAVILRRHSATLINPGFHDAIHGCTFSEGEIKEFETPASKANKTQLKARDMARRREIPKKIRVEQTL